LGLRAASSRFARVAPVHRPGSEPWPAAWGRLANWPQFSTWEICIGLEQHPARNTRSARSRWWYLLLVLPYVGLLWVPIYATDEPELWGFPFFYWYQFGWVPVTALLTWIVYRKVR
jgi:hypothetical protein